MVGSCSDNSGITAILGPAAGHAPDSSCGSLLVQTRKGRQGVLSTRCSLAYPASHIRGADLGKACKGAGLGTGWDAMGGQAPMSLAASACLRDGVSAVALQPCHTPKTPQQQDLAPSQQLISSAKLTTPLLFTLDT